MRENFTLGEQNENCVPITKRFPEEIGKSIDVMIRKTPCTLEQKKYCPKVLIALEGKRKNQTYPMKGYLGFDKTHENSEPACTGKSSL